MDTSPTALIRVLVPQVPLLLKTALWHSLWLSPTSTKWDLKTELTIRFISALLDSPTPTPVSKQQRLSIKDPGIKGNMWISKVTLPRPEENDLRDALVKAVEDMHEGGEKYTIPDISPVEAEWTGYRSDVHSNRRRPDLSEAQHYEKLMFEVSSPTTILYFHGGAYFLCDPSSHRSTTAKLAHLTRGRCFSVRYRLSPQAAFPAALLDALLAYLSLLYPPPGSLHEPVPPSNVVFAGDSAGANLCMSLLQLILQINRTSPSTIRFHDHTVDIPLPAGVATHSPWMDMTRCMPSISGNAHYDYLPPPITREKAANFPHCEIWPTDPPRGDLYCDISMLCHPLVSPIAAKDWTGSCPLWMGYGEEMLVDEGKVVASKAAKQGIPVVWEQWEAMPHCFAMLLEGLEAGKRVFKDWAAFCDAVGGGKSEKMETRGTWFAARTGKEKEMGVLALGLWGEEDLKEKMDMAREARSEGKEGEAKILPQPNM